MQIGKLKHKISIQHKTRTDDGMGSWTESWTEFVNIRAAVWPVSAGEQVRNKQIEQQITSKVRMRYRSGITTIMRIIHKGRTLNISSIINVDEKSRWLDLLCTEVS